MQELHPGLFCAPHTDLGPVRISESAGHRRFGPSLLTHKELCLGFCQGLSVEFAFAKLLVHADW